MSRTDARVRVLPMTVYAPPEGHTQWERAKNSRPRVSIKRVCETCLNFLPIQKMRRGAGPAEFYCRECFGKPHLPGFVPPDVKDDE